MGHQHARVNTYYHFTSPNHLPWIIRDGLIKTTESNVGSPLPTMQPCGQHVGPDVVWLLNTPELTATHGLDGSVYDKTQVRFTVRTRATRWQNWIPGKRMDPEWRRAMISKGGGTRASRAWFVVERAIPRDEWVAVEVRKDGQWFPVPMRLEQAS